MFLKILLMIDEEVADLLYTSSKKAGDQRINTEIKDRIRVFDVAKVSGFLLEVMTAFQSIPEQVELVRQCLNVIGQWIGILSHYKFNA
jgi:Exportin 1-like protein